MLDSILEYVFSPDALNEILKTKLLLLHKRSYLRPKSFLFLTTLQFGFRIIPLLFDRIENGIEEPRCWLC